jgi:hypothetical protein
MEWSIVPLTISPEIREQRRDPELFLYPAILRVSKQIHDEATRVLYGENRFRTHGAGRFLDFLDRIGRWNLALLRTVQLAPSALYYPSRAERAVRDIADANCDGETWCELIDVLARDAKGLRAMRVVFQAVMEVDAVGAGRDLKFVRALERVRQVEEMEIKGFFACAEVAGAFGALRGREGLVSGEV